MYRYIHAIMHVVPFARRPFRSRRMPTFPHSQLGHSQELCSRILHAYIHTYIQYIHTFIRAEYKYITHIHTCILTPHTPYAQICVQYIHTYIHTYYTFMLLIHAYIHTYIQVAQPTCSSDLSAIGFHHGLQSLDLLLQAAHFRFHIDDPGQVHQHRQLIGQYLHKYIHTYIHTYLPQFHTMQYVLHQPLTPNNTHKDTHTHTNIHTYIHTYVN